ncbi:hypothetical protein E2C01_027657 [Portunus trituberculatus]|uniref:Uncharacterized protein n=1 Tax=Portunus trituberculatus TaxID=210409 RepID=A0A5B7EJA9_PORTR|nr:hypothetical protein [Portunus trituberculatus]
MNSRIHGQNTTRTPIPASNPGHLQLRNGCGNVIWENDYERLPVCVCASTERTVERYCGEPDPCAARHESRASLVAGITRITFMRLFQMRACNP